MKIKGKRLQEPYEFLVLPRPATRQKLGDVEVDVNNDVVFKATPVRSFDEFDKLVKQPEAPWTTKPGEAPVRDTKSESYIAAMADYSSMKMHYLFLKSIEATEGISWDKVKIDDPTTYKLLDEELADAGITAGEINRLWDLILTVNGLNAEAYEKARNRFLAGIQVRPVL